MCDWARHLVLTSGALTPVYTLTVKHQQADISEVPRPVVESDVAFEQNFVRSNLGLENESPRLRSFFFVFFWQVAAQTIIAIPYEEQEEVMGPHGRSYVRSVARALPVAVLRPVVGASEALSCTLLGFRNYMSPLIRKEEEGRWK